MKEYAVEDGPVDASKLEAGFMERESYTLAHQGLIIPCHDVFVQYDGGILLVRRKEHPAQGLLWPLGGRIQRGVATEESLRRKVSDESGLALEDLTVLGWGRTFWKTDPFGHGKGTDTINIVYFGRGKGELALNSAHENPTVVFPVHYGSLRDGLHPYVQDFMDLAIFRV